MICLIFFKLIWLKLSGFCERKEHPIVSFGLFEIFIFFFGDIEDTLKGPGSLVLDILLSGGFLSYETDLPFASIIIPSSFLEKAIFWCNFGKLRFFC